MSLPLSVVMYPNNILRTACRALSKDEMLSKKTRKLSQEMVSLMYRAKGIGLAAPQVGASIRLTVIDAEDGEGARVLVNPEIVKASYKKETIEEGCLSLPGVFGMVKRPLLITVAFWDLEGKKQILKCSSPLLSRIVQHEIDHMDGVLFVDRAKRITKGKKLLAQWDRGETPLLDIPYPSTYIV